LSDKSNFECLMLNFELNPIKLITQLFD
jgi:hypothetical protein